MADLQLILSFWSQRVPFLRLLQDKQITLASDNELLTASQVRDWSSKRSQQNYNENELADLPPKQGIPAKADTRSRPGRQKADVSFSRETDGHLSDSSAR